MWTLKQVKYRWGSSSFCDITNGRYPETRHFWREQWRTWNGYCDADKVVFALWDLKLPMWERWHCEACNSVAALRCCLDLEITFSKVLIFAFLWLLQMQPMRCINLKKKLKKFSFLPPLFLTSHTSQCDGLFFHISPLLTSWSSVLVLSRSWTRYHQSWEFLGLGWNEHHYGIGFTFLHFCFLWGCSGTRDCLLLRCSIKICNQVEFAQQQKKTSLRSSRSVHGFGRHCG